MAMLQVECSDCLSIHSLRGYVEKEDLVSTKYEHLMDTITEEELLRLQESGEVKDPWEKWDGTCPSCGSKNVISY